MVKNLEITTIAGIIIGVVCVMLGIGVPGSVGSFLDLKSFILVFGGVLGATVASYPLKSAKSLVWVIKSAFRSRKIDIQKDIDMIIAIANIARREGILAIESAAAEHEDPFVKKGLMLIVDGADPELVRTVMRTELAYIKQRHTAGQNMLLSMSSYSPAFGMVGTLIGLINMLRDLSDPSSLGPNMALALITTFYGIMLANLLFTPMAKHLKALDSEEQLRKELILEGMLSIQDGENPRIILERLNAFLSQSQINPKGNTAGIPSSAKRREEKS